MDKTIQFVANYDDWVAIKKLKIDEKTKPKMIMEFLAGLAISLDRKVEENLGKVVDLGKVDKSLEEEIGSVGRNAADIAKALAVASSTRIGSVINEICELENLQKNERKELKEFCKVYAMKHALLKCGLRVDYSQVEIPGMKRLMKKKV